MSFFNIATEAEKENLVIYFMSTFDENDEYLNKLYKKPKKPPTQNLIFANKYPGAYSRIYGINFFIRIHLQKKFQKAINNTFSCPIRIGIRNK